MFIENFCNGVFLNKIRFIKGQKSYLKDNWNKLDFLIVLVSIIAKVANLGNI